ncbi:hypothetical protein [Georgfuchsia toluolica]|uniref:hypothetical protein n=1 Tax=Georgfuchsia toluolica TaxID=424218 RepID=UPI001C731BCE|nr:hypothetical protein [Georgfuchsia toluolica]
MVYFGARGGRYACRKCLNLAYMTETGDGIDRMWRKQWKLEAKLGPNGERPKGMHWRTYELIQGWINEVEEAKDGLFCVHAARLIGML